MQTNEQNEFLLAEIDWLEEQIIELEKEMSFDKVQISQYRQFNEDLRSKNLSISSHNSILEVRLHKSDEANLELRKEKKELQDENIKLLKTKWYHLLFNINL